MAAAIIGGRRLLLVLLLCVAFNQCWRYLFFLSRATVGVDWICSFWGSAGLLEEESWIKWYYKDPDIKPQTNLTSQQLIKFAWQIADGMSYLSSIPVSDVTILWVMSLQNTAHTNYTPLIIGSWTPHFLRCHVIPCQLSLTSLKSVFWKKHLRFVEGYPSRPGSS